MDVASNTTKQIMSKNNPMKKIRYTLTLNPSFNSTASALILSNILLFDKDATIIIPKKPNNIEEITGTISIKYLIRVR